MAAKPCEKVALIRYLEETEWIKSFHARRPDHDFVTAELAFSVNYRKAIKLANVAHNAGYYIEGERAGVVNFTYSYDSP